MGKFSALRLTLHLANKFRGGMRGIVILEVLRQVQHELGGRIPIQDFFDLVVGTRLANLIWSNFYVDKYGLKGS